MKIEKILKSKESGEIFTLDSDTPVAEAVNQMAQRNYGAVLVTENGEFCGIFTERDLLSCVAYCHGNLGSLQLKDVMTKSPKTIKADEDIAKALGMMTEGRFRHLPVTNDNGKLTGVVSYIDLVRWMIPGALKKNNASTASMLLYKYAGTIFSIGLLIGLALILSLAT